MKLCDGFEEDMMDVEIGSHKFRRSALNTDIENR
jgi:hypothetical protein